MLKSQTRSYPGNFRHGVARPGAARAGVARPGAARAGVARHGVARAGVARPGAARAGVVRSGGVVSSMKKAFSSVSRTLEQSLDVVDKKKRPHITVTRPDENELDSVKLGIGRSAALATVVNGLTGSKSVDRPTTTSGVNNISECKHRSWHVIRCSFRVQGVYNYKGRFVPAKIEKVFSEDASNARVKLSELERKALVAANKVDGRSRHGSRAEFGVFMTLDREVKSAKQEKVIPTATAYKFFSGSVGYEIERQGEVCNLADEHSAAPMSSYQSPGLPPVDASPSWRPPSVNPEWARLQVAKSCNHVAPSSHR